MKTALSLVDFFFNEKSSIPPPAIYQYLWIGLKLSLRFPLTVDFKVYLKLWDKCELVNLPPGLWVIINIQGRSRIPSRFSIVQEY